MNTLTKVVQNIVKNKVTDTKINLIGLSKYKPIPLYKVLLNIPEPIGVKYSNPKITMSTLSNGIRIVTRDTKDPLSNIGLYVDVGSRYLTLETSAAVHYMADMQMSWMSTKNNSSLQSSTGFYKLGGNLQIIPFRDCLFYRAECFNKNAGSIMKVVSDLALNSEFKDCFVIDRHDEYLSRQGDHLQNMEQWIPELIHQAAYSENTYGFPLHADNITIKNITGEVLRDVQNYFFQPNRLIAIGLGIHHAKMEDITFNCLSYLKKEKKNIKKVPPKYTGGELRLKKDVHDGQVHIGLSFETENWHSKDLMAMCVLNMLMGGGGSFSAGGPGKGMYTRLYQDALARFSWINHISCSHSIYEDTAIFLYYGTSQPEHANRLVDVMTHQAKQAADKLANQQELNRAKKSLANNICYEYERREVQFEDIGRQFAIYGEHLTPEQWQSKIMDVNSIDITNVAQRMLNSRPTLAIAGPELNYLPSGEFLKKI